MEVGKCPECNLPFIDESPPEYPTILINERQKEVFGTSIENLNLSNRGNYWKYHVYELILFNNVNSLCDNLKIKYNDFIKTLEYIKIQKDFWNIYNLKQETIAVKRCEELKNKIEIWTSLQPEVVEFNRLIKIYIAKIDISCLGCYEN